MTTKTTQRRSRAISSRSRRRAVMLLEVVLAISILLIGIAVCGLALNNNLQDVKKGEALTRAMLLTEELLTRVDAGQVQMDQTEQSGEFGDPGTRSPTDPIFGYTLSIIPMEQEPEVLRIEATILVRDPTQPDQQAKELLVTKTLRAKPRPLNLKEDFGMSDDQLKMLTDSVPGGAQVLDPENFDPRSLAQLDMDSLSELLPMIMQAMSSGAMSGLDPSQLGGAGGGLPPGMLSQLQQAAAANGQAGAGQGSSGNAQTGSGQQTGQPSGRQTGRRSGSSQTGGRQMQPGASGS